MKTLQISIIAILISTGIIMTPAYSLLTNTISSSQNSNPITISAQLGEMKIENCNDVKETFLINGTINIPIDNSPVQIRVYNPDGTVYDSERIPPSQVLHDGKYWYSLTMIYGNNTAVGPYDMTVSYEGHSAETQIHFVGPMIERAPPSNTISIVDNYGNNLSEIKAGQQVLIQDSIQSMCGIKKFAYIMQVQDQNAATVSLSWIEGSFVGNQPMNFSEEWTPFTAGNYTIQRYLWSSITNPNALEPPVSKTVEVQ
jgi:hypothetical protein